MSSSSLAGTMLIEIARIFWARQLFGTKWTIRKSFYWPTTWNLVQPQYLLFIRTDGKLSCFLKALKQNLKVKTFVGTSENALYIQIWTALIAMLLIKYLQFKSKFNWSLSNLVAFLRWNLFTYRNLWEWIDSPFYVLQVLPKPVQYQLPLRNFGQHPFKKET